VEQDFDSLLQYFKDFRWTSFVRFKYPSLPSQKWKGSRRDEPGECFKDMYYQSRVYPYYFVVRERRENDECVLHSFLQVSPEELKAFRWTWWERCGGSSWEAKVRKDMEGLLRFYAFKLHCDLIYVRGLDGAISSLEGHDYW
jgi:hypothetical protein